MTVEVLSQEPKPARRAATELRRRQRGKNIVVALLLAGLVALFYEMTIVRMGGSAQ
jgi:hypothetical protein